MSNQIKLEAGQWYRDGHGHIVYCIGFSPCPDSTVPIYPWVCCTKTTHIRYYTVEGKFGRKECKQDIVEHLPDCDSFDWEPPKPVVAPEGWRFLTEGERIRATDKWWDSMKWKDLPVDTPYANKAWNEKQYHPMARKIEPKYRPFKNAEEFKPHANKWLRSASTDVIGRVCNYSDMGIVTLDSNCLKLHSFKHCFSVLTFEDGTPFGVLESSES